MMERKLNYFQLYGNNKVDRSNNLLRFFFVVYGCSDMKIGNDDDTENFFIDLACSNTKKLSALKNGELLARSFKTDGSISAPTTKTIRKMAE